MTSVEFNLLQDRLDKLALNLEGLQIEPESEEEESSISREEAADIMNELDKSNEYFIKHPSTKNLLQRKGSTMSILTDMTKTSN